MDPTLATLLLGALGAFGLLSRAQAHAAGPGGRRGAMQRYQRRALSGTVLLLLSAAALLWCARRSLPDGPGPELPGQLALDGLVFLGLGLAVAGLRGAAGAGAAASVAAGLGLSCFGLMVLGFRLVFASEGSPTHAFLLALGHAWDVGPAGIGLLALAHYLLCALLLATAFAVADGRRPRRVDEHDLAFRPVYHLAALLGLATFGLAWSALAG